MTYEPQKPCYTLKLADKSYDVEGSFGLIEAVESALKDHVFSILSRCPSMPASEMAKLLSAILNENGERTTPREIGDILWNTVGVIGDGYLTLCLHVHAFLRITIARPAEREEVVSEMGELLGKLIAPSDSLGKNTESSL